VFRDWQVGILSVGSCGVVAVGNEFIRVRQPIIMKGAPCSADARGLKLQAINEIEALKDAARARGDRRFLAALDKAEERVWRSLRPEYWIDGAHLNAKHGGKVFDEERAALHALLRKGGAAKDSPIRCELERRLWTKTEQSDLGKRCERIANLLLEADEVLARVALDDAQNAAIKNPKKADDVMHKIAGGERELSKAFEAWNDRRYDKAIDRFRDAWKHAQEALKQAAK